MADKMISREPQSARAQALVSWVMDNVDRWETHRQTEYQGEWERFERVVNGEWASIDKNRDSERSRLISPATQQAVEATTAEIEEAIFGRGTGLWFDVSDDVLDEDKEDMGYLRDILREDIEMAKMHQEIRKAVWNGCLYGTGIAKIIVGDVEELVAIPEIDEITGVGTTGTKVVKRFKVSLQAINNKEFAIDPSARTIDDALGCAHIMLKPRHLITAKQKSGVYNDKFLGSFQADSKSISGDAEVSITEDQVKIVEYYGKVPANLLPDQEDSDADSKTLIDTDNTEFVEAFVTIGNDSVELKAVENPMILKDRPIVAYQHDTVNDCFWGRGVPKKGDNPQRALDSELRARIDSMALTVHPMMAVNSTMLPRGFKAEVRPGKVWMANGNPREVFSPLILGQTNATTFPQSADLERMVSMGTGAMDSAAPVSQNPRNQTASGMSMMTSQFVKRSKRTMRNIEEEFLDKIVHKTAWRYMQFDPSRYPVMDYKFKVTSGMGIMARELEQGQLTQLLSVIQPDSNAFQVVLQGIFDNSSLTNKTELLKALEADKQPPSPEQQKAAQEAQELAKQAAIMDVKETESKIMKNIADAQAKGMNAQSQAEAVNVSKVSAVHQALSTKE
jgi:hypothetical protein